MVALKQQLYNLCREYIAKRTEAIQTNITEAREAATNEEKSSAGDKYETGREMMQQEIDLNISQLNEIARLKVLLDQVSPEQQGNTISNGSIVLTSQGRYYIAIGAGQLSVDGNSYYAISSASPIGTKLLGHKAGDEFTLNGRSFLIEEVI